MFDTTSSFIIVFLWLYLNSMITFYFASQIMQLRYTWRRTAMMVIVINIASIIINQIFNPLFLLLIQSHPVINSVMHYLYIFIMNMIVLKFLFHAAWKWRLLFSLFDMGISFLIGQLSLQLIQLIFIKDGFVYGDLQTMEFIRNIVTILLYIPAMYVVMLFWKARKDACLRKSDVMMIALPPLSIITAVFCISVPLSVYKAPNIYLFLSLLLLLFSNLMTCYIYPKLLKKNQLEFEHQSLQERMKQDTQFYHLMQEKYDEQRSLRHDAAKHLRMIQALLQEQEYTSAEGYIAQYIQHYERSRMYQSGNHLLDIMLNSYAEYLRRADIQLDLTSCEQIEIPMNLIDTSIVFGNILENAIASCERSHDKYIQIICKKMPHHMVKFEVINSCDEVKKEEDTFVSLKENGGYGLRNIINTVNKNKGNAVFHYKEQEQLFYSIIHFHMRRDDV